MDPIGEPAPNTRIARQRGGQHRLTDPTLPIQPDGLSIPRRAIGPRTPTHPAMIPDRLHRERYIVSRTILPVAGQPEAVRSACEDPVSTKRPGRGSS